MKFSAWSFIRKVLSHGCAIETDSRNGNRTSEEHFIVLDGVARKLAPELEAALAATVTVPDDVMERAREHMTCWPHVKNCTCAACAMAIWILSLAKRKEGEK